MRKIINISGNIVKKRRKVYRNKIYIYKEEAKRLDYFLSLKKEKIEEVDNSIKTKNNFEKVIFDNEEKNLKEIQKNFIFDK
jgi:hypothetical protein